MDEAYRIAMTVQGQGLLLPPPVPDLYAAIGATRDQSLAIGTEGQDIDPCLVAIQDSQRFSRGNLPQPNLGVVGGGQDGTVRTESEGSQGGYRTDLRGIASPP